jgi:hypothetical protein
MERSEGRKESRTEKEGRRKNGQTKIKKDEERGCRLFLVIVIYTCTFMCICACI